MSEKKHYQKVDTEDASPAETTQAAEPTPEVQVAANDEEFEANAFGLPIR